MARGQKPTSKAAQREKAGRVIGRCAAAQAAGDSVGLSAITVSELEYGAQLSGQYEEELKAVRKLLTPFDLFPYDPIVCPAHYGRIRSALEAKGQIIGSMDLLIAAHALALDATLVSNNVVHFSRVSELRVEN